MALWYAVYRKQLSQNIYCSYFAIKHSIHLNFIFLLCVCCVSFHRLVFISFLKFYSHMRSLILKLADSLPGYVDYMEKVSIKPARRVGSLHVIVFLFLGMFYIQNKSAHFEHISSCRARSGQPASCNHPLTVYRKFPFPFRNFKETLKAKTCNILRNFKYYGQNRFSNKTMRVLHIVCYMIDHAGIKNPIQSLAITSFHHVRRNPTFFISNLFNVDHKYYKKIAHIN